MSEAKNRPSRSKKNRTPIGARSRMSFRGLEEGYKYRVFNDVDDRLHRAQEAGYEFVEADEKLGDPVVAEGSIPGSKVAKPVGGGITGYLMRIPEDWYKEDQQAKQAEVLKSEEALQPKTDEGQYGEGLQTEKLNKE